MPENIYAITETNVDGCGGTATEYVAFDAELDAETADALERYLAEAHETPGDLDTADYVEVALDILAKRANVVGRLVSSPIKGEIRF